MGTRKNPYFGHPQKRYLKFGGNYPCGDFNGCKPKVWLVFPRAVIGPGRCCEPDVLRRKPQMLDQFAGLSFGIFFNFTYVVACRSDPPSVESWLHFLNPKPWYLFIPELLSDGGMACPPHVPVRPNTRAPLVFDLLVLKEKNGRALHVNPDNV